MRPNDNTGHSWSDWQINKIFRAVIRLLLLVPYRQRVPMMGWIMGRIFAPLAGYGQRSDSNLRYIYPDMPPDRRRKIAAGVANNMGRTFIENYSNRDFSAILETCPLSGEGVEALEKAKTENRPVILVSGHFGNYEAPRLALLSRGYNVGGLYRRARNRYFNEHYENTFKAAGGPVFAQGREGTTGFVRHLARGGMLVLLFDQHVEDGENLPFLGKPAATSLSAARLALRYNALLIPFYGIRQTDGMTFEISFEKPVPHSDPETMTRALNTSLEAKILAHPEQWLWIHRRWKIKR